MAFPLKGKDWLLIMKTTMERFLYIFKYMVMAVFAFCLFSFSSLYVAAADKDSNSKIVTTTDITLTTSYYKGDGTFSSQTVESLHAESSKGLKMFVFGVQRSSYIEFYIYWVPYFYNDYSTLKLNRTTNGSSSITEFSELQTQNTGKGYTLHYFTSINNYCSYRDGIYIDGNRNGYSYCNINVPYKYVGSIEEMYSIMDDYYNGNNDAYQPDEWEWNWDADDIEHFYLNNFSVSYSAGVINVSWDGVGPSSYRPLDYKKIFVRSDFVLKNALTGEEKEIYVGSYEAGLNGFSKGIYSYLSDNWYLYSVSCTPFYYEDDFNGGSVVYGESSTQRFNSNGSFDNPDHGGGGAHAPSSGSESILKDFTYDPNCYFIDPTCNTFEINKVNLFHFVWSDVNCTNKDKRIGGIVIDIISGTNSYYYSFDEHFWGEKQLDIDYEDIYMILRLAGVYYDDAVYGIRLIPYYTTLSGNYYGRSYVVSFKNGQILDRVASTTDPIPGDGEFPEYETSTPPPLEVGPAGDLLGSDFVYDDIWSYFISMCKSIFYSAGQFPALVNTVFGFMPPVYIQMIAFLLVVCIILRILGR